ncbi:uncharacterized protein LOC120915992 isoform X2 [Rana temporaria]|uniref:uncharacterized protein LOC120915992 isoform X2 n=1 Tax=Rana temporaria TaxID=8407 RepID=UPI001AADABC2|nr:uncharacterized protein LOC120915992 isoform X2 [Rana temporaria]
MLPLELFVIFSTLAATGHSLICTGCFSPNEDSCTGFPITCPPSYVCASQYTISIIGGVVMKDFQRLCVPQNECNVTGSFTLSSLVGKIATTCCFTDNCSPETPKVPDGSSQPNGVWCQQCQEDIASCTGSRVECTGEDTMCLLETQKTTTGSHTVYRSKRGCASKGFCYKSNMTTDTGGVREEKTYICSGGGLPVMPLLLIQPLALFLAFY